MLYRTAETEQAPFLEKHLHLGGRNAGEDIQINSRYLTRNGKPWVPIMGEMHYTRVPAEQWRETLCRMKAGGISVVSTYVIWIYHEEKEGVFRFDGDRDLREFVRTADDCGLKVALRIGPWVHGEVRNGGFPDWLVKKGIPLRCNDPEYLKYVRRFYRRIGEQVQGQLFFDNGNIWIIQLENELTDRAEHLLELKKIAQDEGLLVPIYTVTGWNAKNGAKIPEREVLPVFGGYVEAPWEQHMEKLTPSSHWFFLPERNDSGIGTDLLPQKDSDPYRMKYELYPFATCEIGGGIQVSCHRRPVLAADDTAASAMVSLGCGNNLPGYYMYRGGINKISDTTLQESRATGYPNDYPIRNYGFQAPLGAWGQTGASYGLLKMQHQFLESFGEMFAPMQPRFQETPVTDRNDTTALRYCIRTDGQKGFVFVNNYQRLDTLAQHREVQFEVPAESGSLIFPENKMEIPSGSYFFMPYEIPVGDGILKYATAQPLWRSGNTWFFAALADDTAQYCVRSADGKEQVYHVEGGKQILAPQELPGVRFVTLTRREAENFYTLGEGLYVTCGAQAYMEDGVLVLRREGNPDLSYYRWNGKGFDFEKIQAEEQKDSVSFEPLSAECFRGKWKQELYLHGKREICGWKLKLPKSTGEELLEITYTGDILQLYADGELEDDDFYNGTPFVTGADLSGKSEIQIWISRLEDGDCYLEQGERSGLSLRQIRRIPIYRHRQEVEKS